MEPNNPRAEAERWLGIAVKLLTARDFLGSKTFAYRAREAEQGNVIADQILAIVDTLLAAEKRINNQYDWYSILQLAHLIRDPDLIVNQYRRMVMLLNPDRNRLPLADHALRLVVDAWSVLSDPTKKWLYDSELSLFLQRLDSQQQQQQQPPPPPPQRVDPIRGGSAQLNTFQFFQPLAQQPLPQPQPEPQPPQSEPQPPPWQQPQIRVQESHQHQPRQQQQPQWQQRPPPPSPPPPQQQHEHRPPQPFQLQQQRQLQSFPSLQAPQQPPRQEEQHQRYQQQQEQQPRPQTTESTEERRSQENVAWRNEGSGVDINRSAAPNEEPDTPRFWTACPYCYYIYEYAQIYLNCTLRCQNCKRAFHAAPVPNPPPIDNGSGSDGKELSSFCCWGFFPLGFSMAKWKKSNHIDTPDGSNWVPFSAMFTCPVNGNRVPVPNGYPAAPVRKKGAKPGVKWLFKDDDDLLDDLSESSGNSDSSGDWGRSSFKKKKKKKKMKSASTTGKKRGRPPKNPLRDSENVMNQNSVPETQVVNGENLQGESGMQEGVIQANNAPNVDASKKAGGSNPRKQTGRGVKSRKKLDLNVEFSNEVEEHATTLSAGNGAEEGIEGISFFEGLDEFLSTLPILNGVNDDKVKPS